MDKQESLLDTKALFAPKKGKQATKGQKQIYEDNRETIRFYSIMAAVSLIFKIFLSSSFSTTISLLLTIFSIIIQFTSLSLMHYMAKPVLTGPSQIVVDGGLDLNIKSGFADNLKDIVITTSICTGLSIFSNGFWCLWLWLPIFFVYKIWVTIVAPWIFSPAPDGPPQELVEKKRKKMERRMARAGYR